MKTMGPDDNGAPGQWTKCGGDGTAQEALAGLLDRLTPHVAEPGADVLLRLALRLLVAGGAVTASFTDLTGLLNCTRSSLATARRLGESLGILRCNQDTRISGRPGPPPLTWQLILPDISPGSEPVAESGLPSQPINYPRGRLVAATGLPSEPVEVDPDQHRSPGSRSDSPDPDRGSGIPDHSPAVARLVAIAAAACDEAQLEQMQARVGPVLGAMLTADWTEEALAALLADEAARLQDYQPTYPASYLATVLRQRLQGIPAGPRRRTYRSPRPVAPAVPRATTASRVDTLASAAEPEGKLAVAPNTTRSEGWEPPCSSSPLPHGLSEAALWQMLLDEVRRQQPDLARHLPTWVRLAVVGETLQITLPTTWLARQLMQDRTRRLLERLAASVVQTPLTIECIGPGASPLPRVVREPVATPA